MKQLFTWLIGAIAAIGMAVGFAMPAGAAEVVPDNLYPYEVAACTWAVPPADTLYWVDQNEEVYQGTTVALETGQTLVLTAAAVGVELVPTSVTLSCPATEDPDPDPNPVKPGKSKGRGPTNGLCINASAHARERVPDKVLARCNL